MRLTEVILKELGYRNSCRIFLSSGNAQIKAPLHSSDMTESLYVACSLRGTRRRTVVLRLQRKLSTRFCTAASFQAAASGPISQSEDTNSQPLTDTHPESA